MVLAQRVDDALRSQVCTLFIRRHVHDDHVLWTGFTSSGATTLGADGVCQAWEWAVNGYSTSGGGQVRSPHAAQSVPLCTAGRQAILLGVGAWALCADLLDVPTIEGAVWAVGTASGGVLIVPSDDGEPIQLSPTQPSSGPVLQVRHCIHSW